MFRNISINEKLWSFELGDCKVTKINKEEEYFIATNGRENYCYSFSGIHGYNIRPTIFWSEPKVEIPKKPFNLKEFLKENLEPKEFSNERSYDCIGIRGKNFKILTSEENVIGTVYFKNVEYEEIEKIEDTLNKNEITLEQLKQAFKELGWL